MTEREKITSKRTAARSRNPVVKSSKTNGSRSINSPIDQILHLQRTVGNRAVQKLFSSGALQTKLRIGQPNDKYEQEADRVADEVMRMPEPEVRRQIEPEEEEEETLQAKPLAEQQITPLVQRQVEEDEEEEEPIQTKFFSTEHPILQKQEEEPGEEEEVHLMTKSISGKTPQIRDDLYSRLNRNGGQPLPEADKSFMERRFSTNFSGVRVHTDSNAIQMNKELNAQAFTHGRNIYFGTGRYRPGTSSGKRLLAHELTHVVQQRSNLMNQQVESIQRHKKIPEWKKRIKKFKQIVLDLKPRKPKSNMEKFNLGLNKLFITLGHKKTVPLLLPKLHVTLKRRLLWLFVTKAGTALWLMKQGKLPNIIPGIKLRRNLLLDVEPGGTFKKPKLMLKLKWTFRGL